MRSGDEIHLWYNPKSKLRIISKSKEQYCFDSIKEDKKPNKNDNKRHHIWASLSYDFKFDICFDEVPRNTNNKMSQRAYIDQILQSILKPWIEAYHNFILKEYSDLSNGLGKSNIVHT